MIEVTRLAKERNVDLADLPDAVRTYKLGVLDNPWRRGYLRRRDRWRARSASRSG